MMRIIHVIAMFFICSGVVVESSSVLSAAIPPIYHADISFDGKRIVWVAEIGGTTRIFVRNLDDGQRTISLSPVSGLLLPHWAGDDRHIYALDDPTGEENTHVLVFDADAPEAKPIDLTPFPGKTAKIINISRPDGSALLAINLRNSMEFGLYRVSPTGGPPHLVEPENRGVRSWLVTSNGDLFGRTHWVGRLAELRLELLSSQRRWRDGFLLGRGVFAAGDDLNLLSDPRPDGTAWFVTRGRSDTATPQLLELATGRTREAAPSSTVDTDLVMMDSDGKALLVQLVPDFPLLRIFDPKLQHLLESLPLPNHARLSNVAWDRNKTRLLLSFESDTGERLTAFVDRGLGKASILERHSLGIAADQQPTTIPISISARDQLRLHGYLTVPAGSNAKGLPLVLLVHGGPQARDRWGFVPEVAILANSGYAVLRVNYRGSSGYGRAFEQAGEGEWGGKMQDDLTDAVCWAVAQRIADPHRLAIVGGSYGGYAAMEALVHTPKLFAAAVSVNGPSDLPALLDEAKPYAHPLRPVFEAYIGRSRSEQWERSPLAHVERIVRPLLAFQGRNDGRVKESQLRKMESAMKMAGKPISAIYLDDDGHNLLHAKNFKLYVQTMLSFLHQHLITERARDNSAEYCRP